MPAQEKHVTAHKSRPRLDRHLKSGAQTHCVNATTFDSTMHMSPALKRNSEISCFERSDTIEMRNRITFVFFKVAGCLITLDYSSPHLRTTIRYVNSWVSAPTPPELPGQCCRSVCVCMCVCMLWYVCSYKLMA